MIKPLYQLAFAPALLLVNMPTWAAPSAAPSAVAASNVEEKSAAFEFSYSYPLEAAAIPKLTNWLRADRMKSRKELVGWAKEGMADAKANAYEYRAYTQGTHWEVAGTNGPLLSLAGTFDSYTGGAHGSYGFRFLLWDRKAGKALKAYGDVFIKGPSALNLLRKDYCAALDAARAENRGKEWQKEAGSIFDECPSFTELAIGFSGKAGQPLDTVQLIAGPYVAGSYAEGPYEITLPISNALLAVVKPKYRSAFVGR